MVFNDHINLMGANPLIGKNDDRFGERFPDMLDVYSDRMLKNIHAAAKNTGVQLFEGMFVGLVGPNFETKGELKMLRAIGGDIIGWSSIPEVLAARHMNMEIMGLTLVTDMSVPETLEPVDAQKVLDTAKKAVPDFIKLMKDFLSLID
jgi:purine-nucleoside phosphorylase